MVVRRLENTKFRGVAVTKLNPHMVKHSRTTKLTIFSAYFQGSFSLKIKTTRKQDTFSAKRRSIYERTGTSSSSEVMFSFGTHDHNYSPYTDGAGFEY